MRAFGLEISGNARTIRGNRKELRDTERAAIVAARQAGVPRRVLADNFDCSIRTINRTVKHFQIHETLRSLPRSGRPEKLNRRQKRYILRLVKRSPRMSWAALVGQSPVGVSKSTLRRVLGGPYRRKWRARKRITLQKHHARERLGYIRDWKGKLDVLVAV